MKFRIISVAILFAAILSFLGTATISNAASSAEFSLITDKLGYDYGEQITFSLRAVNTGLDNLTLAFPSACQADYIIDDLAKTELVCAQVLTEVVIKPGESHDWTFTNKPGQGDDPILMPGTHNIRAVLIGYPSATASQSITVDYANSGEGQYCGGIAEILCPTGLTCQADQTFGGYCHDTTLPAPAKGQLSTESSSKFKDVSASHWASVYINLLADKGLIQGYADDTFRPDNYVTRAELTKMSLTGAGIEPTAGLDGSFGDLDEWQKSWVYTAQNLNIVKGYNPRQFDPNRPITRAEALKIMLLAFNTKQTDIDAAALLTIPFTDVPADSWFRGYVAYGYGKGILQGYQNKTFLPGNFITRGEAAKIIAKLWQNANS
jgi:hypothetical protein